MKKIYCLLSCALLSLSSGFAQENHLRNSKWFCYDRQLEFTTENPNSFPQETYSPFGGIVTASVCDQNGDQLIVVNYYGGTVLVKGQNIGSISSAYENNNVIIVPKPKHPDRYYIITSSEIEGLKYTEVNLINRTLINKDTPLKDHYDTPILSSPGGSGVASTVHANGTDYWIIAFANDYIVSYLVTEKGIDTSINWASSLPDSEASASLRVKISPKTSYNTQYIAIVNFYNGVSLKEFNNEIGAITNSYSSMNDGLTQRELHKWHDGIHSVDAEFSADGRTLYCVDDLSDFGSVYAIQDSGNIILSEEYGGFVASQRGADGFVYFLEGHGGLYQEQPSHTNANYTSISLFSGSFRQRAYLTQLVSIDNCLASNAISIMPTFDPVSPVCYGNGQNPLQNVSINGISGSWSPAFNNFETTTYTFTASADPCTHTTTMTVVVTPIIPTFSAIAPICSGTTLNPLPTTSDNGITGSWSPAVNNTATTTYTFTPTAGQCAPVTTMTIVVNPKTTPAFSAIVPICAGSTLTLPTTSTNGITGSWSPVVNNMATTIYTFTPTAGLCANTTTMTVTVNQKTNPTFNAIVPICAGSTLTLPTTSTNGITGSWSPAVNNMATTNYTFTPTAGLCANTNTMTVTVKTTPVFNNIAVIESDPNSYVLPYESANGINGTWNPASVAEGKNNYTFTPDSGDCPITKSFTFVKQKTISAVYDDFSTTPINGDSGGITPSVFSNDYIIDGDVVSSANATFEIVSVNPTPIYPFTINFDGTINVSARNSNYGTYVVEYKITQRSCPENYDTSFATIVLTDPNATGRKSNNIAQKTSEVLTVYPNPSNGIYNVDLTSVKGDYDTVRVFSMLGSLIYESNLNSKSTNQIDLSHVATGCYIAKVSGNSGGTSFQLIKQ